MRARVLTLLVLSACGYPQDRFVKDRNAALCDLFIDCFGVYADEATCKSAQRRDSERPCSSYNLVPAITCVQQLRAQAKDCPTRDLDSWQIPPRCAEMCVYPVWDTDT